MRSVFDRYDMTSEVDLEAAAAATSRQVAEKRRASSAWTSFGQCFGQ